MSAPHFELRGGERRFFEAYFYHKILIYIVLFSYFAAKSGCA
jgi:hypothetical protein